MRIPDAVELKPAKRPRFRRASVSSALEAAARMSLHYKQTIYVHGYNYNGMQILMKRPASMTIPIFYSVLGRSVTKEEVIF